MTTDPTSQQGHAAGEDARGLAEALHRERCDMGRKEWVGCHDMLGNGCEDIAPRILASDWFAARVAAARAEALQPVLDLLDDEWYDEPPTATYPEGRRLYRWPADLRDHLRAVVSREPGEGDKS